MYGEASQISDPISFRHCKNFITLCADSEAVKSPFEPARGARFLPYWTLGAVEASQNHLFDTPVVRFWIS